MDQALLGRVQGMLSVKRTSSGICRVEVCAANQYVVVLIFKISLILSVLSTEALMMEAGGLPMSVRGAPTH